MQAILEALLPIFLLVLLGSGFRRFQFPAEGFWVAADRLTYYVFLPALLTEKLSTTVFTWQDFYNLTGVMCVAVLAIALLVLLLHAWRRFDPPTLTSIFQGSIRPNSYVALAAGTALFGPKGLALTAIIMAGVVPLVNVLSVAAFAFFVPNGQRRGPSFFRSVASNPLVLACALGIMLNVTGVGLPFVAGSVLEILSAPALPMGLISVGYGLMLRGTRGRIGFAIVAIVMKLLVLPAIAYILLIALGVVGQPLQVAIIFASVPCAVSSYILAGHLGGDQQTMAAIITIETLAAFVTMPLILNALSW
ncbi:MAG: AEC family transporter [Bacteroidota bacterium]